MDLDKIKSRINELLYQLDVAIKLLKTFASEDRIEILEELERCLQKLLGHIHVLESEDSLALLEAELREASETLSHTRETLLRWEPADQELVAEVEAAKVSVDRYLGKVKSGRSTKKKAPVLLMVGIVAFAAYSKKR